MAELDPAAQAATSGQDGQQGQTSKQPDLPGPVWKQERVRAIANEWRSTPVLSGCSWSAAENQFAEAREGESGGLWVKCARYSDRRGYMKPRKADRRFGCRAPREKIAADLAHDLGVPVPPVVLAHRSNAPATEERFVCVSLVTYQRQVSWGQLRDNLMAKQPNAMKVADPIIGAAAAKGLAFDTWVDQRDHGDHESNILLGYVGDLSDVSFVFLDYAFSMGMTGTDQTWQDGNFLLAEEAPFPPLMRERLDPVVLDETIKSITAYPDSMVEEVVNRIPEGFIGEAERESIRSGLLERKRHLRRFLSKYLRTDGGAR